MDQAKRFSVFPPLPDVALRIEPRVFHYSAWQNISIGVWVGQATLAAVHSLLKFGAEVNRRYPDGHSSFVFILDQLPAPTPDAREALGKLFNARTLLCAAVVLEGSGFWASGLRSMIANTHRTGTGNVKLRVSTSLEDALSWFPAEHARLSGIDLDVAQLRSELLYAREHGARAALNA